ncbi:hypothetical protein IW140_003345 [Coemansia sp. RSA 1813]|nr:hypothetical protein EV178_001840 [Coemansia sp. RSA 1646]KAJ1768513.1 hypothetical protein LPJ74_004833 [Coemansia sp. RSA 1843]KAJ2093017.1 hypothetical protein IW138_000731 [Coemansia sp. RSA 986]KAJ2214075.1 hypothetical protein EV179_003319 [Coemansia sp. RSA 487]KAJ2569125.1 hypothetical protein IW140_003345 [Coemansia sp. RSA 1813]
MVEFHSTNDRVKDKARLEWHQRMLSFRRHTPESLNVMVVGRRGVGKSTLLQTICDSFYSLHIESLSEGNRVMFPSASFKESNVVAEEVLDPFCVFDSLSGTTLIRRCKVRIKELLDSQPISIEFIDTPGIDSNDEQKAAATINEICGEIERRLQATLDEEQRTQRNRSTFASAHIHAIIYMLPPPVYYSATTDSHSHRLEAAADIVTAADLRAIRRFSQYANVIPAVGKCDTIELADRHLLKDESFYREVRDLLVPDRLFDFSDTPNTPYKEPYEEVRAYRRAFLRKLPFLVCGSKHVDEWQQMRLPEYQNSSTSRVSVADWRVLVSKHNRVSSSAEMITKGIFRDHRRHSNIPDPTDPNSPAAMGQRMRELKMQHEHLLTSTTSSIQSLPTRSDSIQIKRWHQRREISLIREFSWGTLQINNPDHCDVAALLDVLFVSFRKSLEYWTDETHYEKYRMQRIASDPNYADKNNMVATYLEQEKTRFAMPISTHHHHHLGQSSSSQAYNRHSDGNNRHGSHYHSKRYSRHQAQRRLTTGDIASGNGNDISIVSNAATAGNASSMLLRLPRELDTRNNSDSNTSNTNINNDTKSETAGAFGGRGGNTAGEPEFKFHFPMQHTNHLGSPPDTAITAVTSATAATTISHTPIAQTASGPDEPNSDKQPMASNPHRVSAATTLTTMTTSLFKSPSAASSVPEKQKSTDAGSSVRRGIHMLFSVGGSGKAKAHANPAHVDSSNNDQRGRRYTINTASESAMA